MTQFDLNKFKSGKAKAEFVTVHGKRIDVEVLKTPRRYKAEPFAKVPLRWSAAVSKAVDMQRSHILVVLAYRGWKAKGQPFAFTNAELKAAGVTRGVKHRMLHDLERAGIIAVKWLERRAPIVTLLVPL